MDETQFIKKYTDSLNKLELLVFFSDNPSTMDTADSISIWSGIPVKQIQEILDIWIDQGLVKKEGVIYYFQPDDHELLSLSKQVVQTYKSTRILFRQELDQISTTLEKEKRDHQTALSKEIGKTDTLLQNITEAVAFIDNTKTIIKCNRVFLDLFPQSQERSPLSFDDIFHNVALKEAFSELIRKGGGTYQGPIGDRYFEVTVTSIKDENGETIIDDYNEVIGYFWVFRDVSDRKKIEKIKDDLSRMITHDLRSPMTGIFTAFEMILKSGERNLPENLYKSCQLGKRTSQFLLGLVNDLMDVQRIEDGVIPIQRQVISLNQIIAESLEHLESLIKDRQISVIRSITSELMNVLGDHDKLIRVFVNLITNALKFTPKKGNVSLSLKRCDKKPAINQTLHLADNPYALVTIDDNGYGIPEDQLPHIFDKYYRAQQSGRSIVAGTGLGLYFCKLIINAHHGEIWAESELNKGSTFFFVLPLCKEI